MVVVASVLHGYVTCCISEGYVSQIENGKIPNIERTTVQNVARALNIDIEEIPVALRWPEAAVAVKNTNTIAHAPHEQKWLSCFPIDIRKQRQQLG